MASCDLPPYPLGISFVKNSTRFCLFSAHAKKVELGLFSQNSTIPTQIIALLKSGDFWCLEIENLPLETRYAYRCHGDWDEIQRNFFKGTNWLLDPYAKFPDTSVRWKGGPFKNIKAIIKEAPPFDWGTSIAPQLAPEDLIIYEMHVRGFTAHESSQSKNKGTFAAIIEKIPYLKELGITAIELLPIYEFDECNCKNINPETDEQLVNYWGYNPISFFAPKRSYSSSADSVTEFKQLVKALHDHKIEVILDVVYNHTGEGSLLDPFISWGGIDHQNYYLQSDFTGCGNTLNANHPQVQTMILDSLHYWAQEMHVDGFRFDLASTLVRDTTGMPMSISPILKAIAEDPILKSVKLIAEPWDAGGLYQVGSFHSFGPWMEWNGKYRDAVRTFLKGTDGQTALFAASLMGSEDLYHASSPLSSINFTVAHDGFCLNDLVTYQFKHNQANGENNRDGSEHNDNWNCGEEGSSSNAEIAKLRERQIRNHWLALLLSQGIPMILMGDEYRHTRFGNNNPYPQDNELNWFLWDQLEQRREIFDFVSKLIAFRKAHPALRQKHFLSTEHIHWHGIAPHQPNFDSRLIAFSTTSHPRIYCVFNAHHEEKEIELPAGNFHLVVTTAESWDNHHFQTLGPLLESKICLSSHTALLAIEQ